MHTTRTLAGALTSVGLAAAGFGLGTGAAAANPPGAHTWRPGMSMHNPPGPEAVYAWDDLDGSNPWDGPNPPPGSIRLVCGNDMFTGIPIPC